MRTPTPNHRMLPGMLVATGLSVTGNAMVAVLIPWLILSETNSPGLAGTIASVAGFASLISLIFGAGLIDRVDRRNFAAFADGLSALAVAAIPIVQHFFGLGIAWLVTLVALGALFDGPGRAAREALRPLIAKRVNTPLEKVNGLGEVADSIGFLIGPAIAGGLVALSGVFPALWWSAGVFVIAAVTLLCTQPKDRKVADAVLAESYFASSINGLKLIWADPILRGIAITAALFGLVISPLIFLLTTAFEARDASGELGIVLSAFAFGAIGGSLGYAHLGVKLPRRGTLVASFVLAAVGLVGMAFFLDHTLILIGLSAVTGVVAAPSGPVLSLLMQERSSEEVRGRVLATMGAIEATMAPAALAAAGLLVQFTSLQTTYLACAIGTLLTGLFTAGYPAFRRIERGVLTPTTEN